jgi:hypothetical protein
MRNFTPHWVQTVFFPACSGETTCAFPQLSHANRNIGAPREEALAGAGTGIAAPHCLQATFRPAYFSSVAYVLPQPGHWTVMLIDPASGIHFAVPLLRVLDCCNSSDAAQYFHLKNGRGSRQTAMVDAKVNRRLAII